MKKLVYLLIGSACMTGMPSVSYAQDLPTLHFVGARATLDPSLKQLLAGCADIVRDNPGTKYVVTGYCSSRKADVQRSWDRVYAVISYMVEKEGISPDRFIFAYGKEDGDCNTVDLRKAAAEEEGPTSLPAPYPHLRRSHK